MGSDAMVFVELNLASVGRWTWDWVEWSKPWVKHKRSNVSNLYIFEKTMEIPFKKIIVALSMIISIDFHWYGIPFVWNGRSSLPVGKRSDKAGNRVRISFGWETSRKSQDTLFVYLFRGKFLAFYPSSATHVNMGRRTGAGARAFIVIFGPQRKRAREREIETHSHWIPIKWIPCFLYMRRIFTGAIPKFKSNLWCLFYMKICCEVWEKGRRRQSARCCAAVITYQRSIHGYYNNVMRCLPSCSATECCCSVFNLNSHTHTRKVRPEQRQ